MASTDSHSDILIVDDKPENLAALETALAGLGGDIVRASSGQQALEVLLGREFAVILLDVRMPDMDGLETAQYIRKSRRSMLTPIIFVTAAEDDLDQVVRGYSAGAVDYMIKPLQVEILRSKVRVFIDLHRKNQEIARANEELRHAYKELEVVSYTVAHDLRAPLRAMAGFSGMIRENYAGKPLDAAGLEYAGRIEAGAKRMDALIQSLLGYCHVAGMKLEMERVDLSAVIEEAVATSTSRIGGTAEIRIDKCPRPVLGHQQILTEVLSNLVSNSLRFVAPGVQPQVCIKYETRPGRVRLLVEDNGVGIKPEYHDRLFRPFESINPEAPSEMGMGLAIVKTAVERMGGNVGLESTPGSGSRFWVELPEWPEPTPARSA